MGKRRKATPSRAGTVSQHSPSPSWGELAVALSKRVGIALVVIIVVGALSGIAAQMALSLMHVVVGFSAKFACSGTFVQQRSMEDMFEHELRDVRMLPRFLLDVQVDRSQKVVSASGLMGVVRVNARYHGGHVGCSIIDATGRTMGSGLWFDKYLDLSYFDYAEAHKEANTKGAPRSDGVFLTDEVPIDPLPHSNVDVDALNAAIRSDIEDAATHTLAVVIAHDGEVIAEGYNAEKGVSIETPLLGWSMTKSLLSALVGIAVKHGNVSLEEFVHHPSWRCDELPDDPRCSITVASLLEMRSGLEFDETYGMTDDPAVMLFTQQSASDFAASRPRVEPDEWNYSSGSSNVLSYHLRHKIGSWKAYLEFPLRYLFGPLNMRSAVMEPDAAGVFVGSSFSYMTARDWAKFGQLYLQDGVWRGEQLLPRQWVDYTRTPVPGSHGAYGGSFWLNMYGTEGDKPADLVEKCGWTEVLPDDAYYCGGHQGQLVMIVPSKKLVVVRLGRTSPRKAWDRRQFFARVMDAVGH